MHDIDLPVRDAGDTPVRGSRVHGVRFAYLRRAGDPAPGMDRSLLHLRTSRMTLPGPAAPGLLGRDPWRAEYLRNLPLFTELLAGAARDHDFDHVVSPPSRFDHALPYRMAFLRRRPLAGDLSGAFAKTQPVYAGCGHPFPALCRAFSFRPGTCLQGARSILIVDDILWQGTTAAAVIHHLRRRGLPESARILLACPLWID